MQRQRLIAVALDLLVAPRVKTAMKKGPEKMAVRPDKLWGILGFFFLGLYAIATLAPTGALWGLHALGYFPWGLRVVGLVWCAALLWQPGQAAAVRWMGHLSQALLAASPRSRKLVALLVVSLFGAFYVFAMRSDIYGDTPTILRWYADNKTLPLAWFARLFDLHLLAHREYLTLLLHRVVAHALDLPIGQAYRLMSAVSGACCLLLWVLFVRRTFAGSRWGGLLVALGCLIGANQIFFGHVETYAFASLPSLGFLLAGWMALRNPRYFWAATALLLLAIAAHPASLYFVPAYVVLAAHVLGQRIPAIRSWLTWRRLGIVLVVPSLILALCLYLFYFRSFAEPYSGAGRDFAHSFLPMVPAAPPLNAYTLLSVNHLRDLFNVLLLVGMPVLFALLGLVLIHPREIAWKHPEVVFASFALAYPLLFFATVNPELSMPRDWDMYALLGPPLLMMIAALLAHSGDRVPQGPIIGTSLALGTFSLAFCALNASPGPLSAHLEVVGEYAFTTYHTGASYILNTAQSMEPDLGRALGRREATIKRLASHVVGADAEYINLLATLARIYRDRGQLDQGIQWFEEAARVSPNDANVSLWLIDAYLEAHRPLDAERLINPLLEHEPQNATLLSLAAIEASQEENLESALVFLERAKVADPTNAQVDAWTADVRKAIASRQDSARSRRRRPAAAATASTPE